MEQLKDGNGSGIGVRNVYLVLPLQGKIPSIFYRNSSSSADGGRKLTSRRVFSMALPSILSWLIMAPVTSYVRIYVQINAISAVLFTNIETSSAQAVYLVEMVVLDNVIPPSTGFALNLPGKIPVLVYRSSARRQSWRMNLGNGPLFILIFY